MKATHLAGYFFFLASNWNLHIAWHIIRQEIRGEKKYGIDTTGADELKELENKGIDITHATIYMPASYDMLDDVFSQLKISGIKHFIDIGCGKGRALCVAAYKGMKKITGVDFSREFCNTATTNLEIMKEKIPYLEFTIKNNDAFYFSIPSDTDCLFLFNPFDKIIMSSVVNNLLESYHKSPRQIQVIYLNPLYKELFTDNGFIEVYHVKKMNYLEGVILQKSVYNEAG